MAFDRNPRPPYVHQIRMLQRQTVAVGTVTAAMFEAALPGPSGHVEGLHESPGRERVGEREEEEEGAAMRRCSGQGEAVGSDPVALARGPATFGR